VLLNIVAFVPDPGSGVAGPLEPGSALRMREKTVLEYFWAEFGGYSRSYATVAATKMTATTITAMITAAELRWQKHHAKLTRQQPLLLWAD
jgi:hypothetical protein